MNAMKELEIKQVILNNPALEEKLATVESYEDIKAVFAAYDCQLSDEDIDTMFNKVAASCAEGELDEENLDNVAGGISWGAVKLAWGVGKRAGIGIRMVYDHYKYGNAQKNYSYKQLVTGKLW